MTQQFAVRSEALSDGRRIPFSCALVAIACLVLTGPTIVVCHAADSFELVRLADTNLVRFTNDSGQQVTGLRIVYAGELGASAPMTIGGWMEIETIDSSRIELSGICASMGTIELQLEGEEWQLVSAHWLQDGRSIAVIDTGKPVARMLVMRESQSSALIFQATGSADPSGNRLVGYEWEFSDGVIVSGYKISRSFAELGCHWVTLRVFAANGLTGELTRAFWVRDAVGQSSLASRRRSSLC